MNWAMVCVGGWVAFVLTLIRCVHQINETSKVELERCRVKADLEYLENRHSFCDVETQWAHRERQQSEQDLTDFMALVMANSGKDTKR